jgi:hypothetical protein
MTQPDVPDRIRRLEAERDEARVWARALWELWQHGGGWHVDGLPAWVTDYDTAEGAGR